MIIIRAEDIQSIENQKRIQQTIKKGGLVVFPTETVYGIGADATNPEAVKKIFEAKGRPTDNPLIVHLAFQKDLDQCVLSIPELAYPLMTQFWPGPLTLVFKKKTIIPPEVSGGLDTVGIRIPSSEVARDVIRAAGVPICAPSANLSGKPSSTLFKHVLEDFSGKVDIMIDGGQVSIGLESTVLDLTTPIPVLLRPGAITKKMIEETLHMGIMDATHEEVRDIPKSPGMKYTHYAPKGEVNIIEGSFEHVVTYINQQVRIYQPDEVGVIAPNEYMQSISAHYKVNLGSLTNLNEVAKNIFLALRQMDALKIKIILIPALPAEDLGQAIMNRLTKAAGHRINHV
jgi:L-threonylcarbamoyladenylate synthase